jgi:beta propeller repeat protein
MSRAGRRGLALAALVWASCSACNNSPATPDARRDLPRIPDRIPTDLPLPDGPPPGCGGSRVLQPTLIKRTTGMPCGVGCEQVNFGYDVMNYEVAGDLLVYSGGDLEGQHAIYVDLKTRSEWLVHKAARHGVGCFTVDTDGTRIAYSCIFRPDTTARFIAPIQVYDPLTKTEEDLQCLDMPFDKSGLPNWITLGSTGIAAQLSLTSDTRRDIFFHRFSDKALKNLTQSGGVWQSTMDGPLVVWTQGLKQYSQTLIVSYDTRDNKSTVLDPDHSQSPNPTGGQWEPRIRGDKVVWTDHRNAPGDFWNKGNSDIYLHDLSTGKTVAVTTHPARQESPDVEGDWVVWQDFRNNPDPTPRTNITQTDVYARNMKTGQEARVTSYTGLVQWPRIDRGRVFFMMYSKTPTAPVAVFMIDLEERLKKR